MTASNKQQRKDNISLLNQTLLKEVWNLGASGDQVQEIKFGGFKMKMISIFYPRSGVFCIYGLKLYKKF